MLDKNNPFFTESYVNGTATFTDFYSTYEKAYEAAQGELKDESVTLVTICIYDFGDTGEYEGITLLWLESVWREHSKAENVFDSGVQVIEGTDIYLVIARSAVEVEYDLQPLACFSERLSAPLGALTLGAALGPVADLLNGVYREHYQVWEARALGAAPEDIPESYGGAIPTRVQSVRRVDSKILIRLVPE